MENQMLAAPDYRKSRSTPVVTEGVGALSVESDVCLSVCLLHVSRVRRVRRSCESRKQRAKPCCPPRWPADCILPGSSGVGIFRLAATSKMHHFWA